MLKIYFFLFLLLNFIIINSVSAYPILTIYTHSSFCYEFGPGSIIKKEFEKQYCCKLKFVNLKDSITILNRLRLEGIHSKADIVLGLDSSLLQEAHNTKLFAKHDINIDLLNLPERWYDLTFLPYDYGYFAFIYNEKKLKNPPCSFHELANSFALLKIIYEDPRTSTLGLGLLLWIQKIYGVQAPLIWKKLARKTITITKNWSEAYGLFLKGEADMVFSYTTSQVYHKIIEKTNQYKAAFFNEGHYLNIEVVAKLKTSKNPKLANNFLQFVLSPIFQQTVLMKNWMYPVIFLTLPPEFNRPSKQISSFSPEQIIAKRTEWITNWQKAIRS